MHVSKYRRRPLQPRDLPRLFTTFHRGELHSVAAAWPIPTTDARFLFVAPSWDMTPSVVVRFSPPISLTDEHVVVPNSITAVLVDRVEIERSHDFDGGQSRLCGKADAIAHPNEVIAVLSVACERFPEWESVFRSLSQRIAASIQHRWDHANPGQIQRRTEVEDRFRKQLIEVLDAETPTLHDPRRRASASAALAGLELHAMSNRPVAHDVITDAPLHDSTVDFSFADL